MAVLDFDCPTCGPLELNVPVHQPTPTACTTCGGELKRLWTAPAIHLTGPGFYRSGR